MTQRSTERPEFPSGGSDTPGRPGSRSVNGPARVLGPDGGRVTAPEAADQARGLPTDSVFVGGSGRSGTTMLGRLIGMHSRYFGVPTEAKFHVLLPRVLRGQLSVEAYSEAFRTTFVPKLGRLAPEQDLLGALTVFERTVAQDGRLAATRLVRAVLDPMAMRSGAPGWVEMTPANLVVAAGLSEVLPGARFVHILRDGRDVAASVSRTWGQMSQPDALEWWAGRMRGIKQQFGLLRPEQAMTLRLERLIGTDRAGSLARLLAFLDVDAESAMQTGFDQQMSQSLAHVGRWRHGLSAAEQERMTTRYQQLLDELGPDEASGLADLTATVADG